MPTCKERGRDKVDRARHQKRPSGPRRNQKAHRHPAKARRPRCLACTYAHRRRPRCRGRTRNRKRTRRTNRLRSACPNPSIWALDQCQRARRPSPVGSSRNQQRSNRSSTPPTPPKQPRQSTDLFKSKPSRNQRLYSLRLIFRTSAKSRYNVQASRTNLPTPKMPQRLLLPPSSTSQISCCLFSNHRKTSPLMRTTVPQANHGRAHGVCVRPSRSRSTVPAPRHAPSAAFAKHRPRKSIASASRFGSVRRVPHASAAHAVPTPWSLSRSLSTSHRPLITLSQKPC